MGAHILLLLQCTRVGRNRLVRCQLYKYAWFQNGAYGLRMISDRVGKRIINRFIFSCGFTSIRV